MNSETRPLSLIVAVGVTLAIALWAGLSLGPTTHPEWVQMETIRALAATPSEPEASEMARLGSIPSRRIAAAAAVLVPPAVVQPREAAMQAVEPSHARISPSSAALASPKKRAAHPGVQRTVMAIDRARKDALGWLVGQQKDGGYWTREHAAPGEELRITSLAALALALNDPSDPRSFAAETARAVTWLMGEQNVLSGRLGAREGPVGALDHALSTYVLGELMMLGSVLVDPEELSSSVEAGLAYLEAQGEFLSKGPAASGEEYALKWKRTTARLRALFDAETRVEQLAEDRTFLDWRYHLYHDYGNEDGAHDAFASFTSESLAGARAVSAAGWMDRELEGAIHRDGKGALTSSHASHATLGRTGVTALYCIVFTIVRQKLVP